MSHPDADLARTALLVVDAQHDFLAPGGAFGKRHCDTAQLAQTLAQLARAARAQGRAVAWIASVYGEGDPPPEELRGQTHTGAPCCVRGSWGAELVAPVADLAREAPPGWRIEKRWYSAFRDTGLHASLQAAGVTRVVLCGVATNVCVLATARDARAHGYEVDVLEDATAAGTLGKHTRALRELAALGARIRRWGDLLADGPVRLDGLGAGGAALWCGALRDCIDDAPAGEAYAALEREVAWSAMLHRGGEVPRRVAIQGDRTPEGDEPLYRHPADEQPALRAWTPTVDAIRRAVERHVGHALNHCLIQLYRDGRDWISEHADKTLDLVSGSSIVNVSLGRMRTMVLRPKRAREAPEADRGRATQKIPLPHGSFLVMDLATNREYLHAIPQQASPDDDGPRISLTFRHIGTLWNPATAAVWGVGAPTQGRAEALSRARARAELPPAEREAWERAEAERLLVLFRAENIDPAFDRASYHPGSEVLHFRVGREGA